MNATQTSMLPPTPSDERAGETDTAERCDDPTPRGVIRAALGAAITTHPGTVDPLLNCGFMGRYRQTIRVLDVGAGYGAWSSELRRLAQAHGWPVHITGVELHAAREKHGRKWCDEWRAGIWQGGRCLADGCDGGKATKPSKRKGWLCGGCGGTGSDLGQFDLAIGNPPFDELTGPKGAKRPPDECMPAVLLRHAPAVLLLHTQQAFLKSEAGRASWRHNPPAASWLVPGGVKFRGPHAINPKNGKKYGADSDCYQVTLWLRGHTGPCSTYMLPDLPAADRQWIIEPGTEKPSKCQRCGGSRELLSYKGCGMLDNPLSRICPDCNGSGIDPNGDLPSAPGWTP